METVNAHWRSLCQDIEISEEIQNDWWAIISRRYNEEWRFYHSLDHIKHLLQLFCQWREFVIDLKSVRLAIFFHDIVYDPIAPDNELQSEVVFQKFAFDAKLSAETVSRVSEMIKATISHAVPADCKDLDLCLFLDFDLAILGADQNDYVTYTKNIRREYNHFDDLKFCQGRTQVLQSLLESRQIFATEELRDIYEAQARKNMHNELESLKKNNDSVNL